MLVPSYEVDPLLRPDTFLGRKAELRAFDELLQQPGGAKQHRVLSVVGIGGQGKTRLLGQMRQRCSVASRIKHPTAMLDFDLAAHRDPVNALLMLRNGLADHGLATNAFDLAFARHFTLTSPGRDIRADHPELFRFKSELVGELAEIAGGIFFDLPGGKLVHSTLSRLSDAARSWYSRRGTGILAKLDDLESQPLRSALPMFLGYDLRVFCDEAPDAAPVIFFDTYEALWSGSGGAANSNSLVDAWLRQLVQDAPGPLFVIAGRRGVDWNYHHAGWGEVIRVLELGRLEGAEASVLLDEAGVKHPDIRTHMIDASQGHALTLRLMIRTHTEVLRKGLVPCLDDFPSSQAQALERFIGHLDPSAQVAVRALSVPSYVESTIYAHLARMGLSVFDLANREELLSEIFFREVAPGRFLMHELVRDQLYAWLERNDPSLWKRVHEALFDYFDRAIADDKTRREGLEVPDLSTDILIRDEGLAAAARHLKAAHPENFVRWSTERLKLDNLNRGTHMHAHLVQEARSLLVHSGTTSLSDLAALARVELEGNPLSHNGVELLDLALQRLGGGTKLTDEIVADVSHAVWHVLNLDASGAAHRLHTTLGPILKDRQDELSYALRLRFANLTGERASIVREVAACPREPHGNIDLEPMWDLCIAIAGQTGEQAIDALHDHCYRKGDTELAYSRMRVALATDSFVELGRPDLARAMCRKEFGQSDLITLIEAAPRSAARYATELLIALYLRAMLESHEESDQDQLYRVARYVLDRIKQEPPTEAGFAIIAEHILGFGVHQNRLGRYLQALVHQRRPPYRREHYIGRLPNFSDLSTASHTTVDFIGDANLDLFVSDRGELCVLCDQACYFWRASDYCVQIGPHIVLHDALNGYTWFGIEIKDALRKHISRGRILSFLVLDKKTRKVQTGADLRCYQLGHGDLHSI